MASQKDNVNILTFDIEEWFHANYAGLDLTGANKKSSRFRANMDAILNLCGDTGTKATFFVLGCIGERYPDVVKTIAREGHDLASHGCGHQLAYEQTYQEFKDDVKKSLDILQELTGVKVLGYRAPSWSIAEKNYHYLEALEELGLKYDASIFPIKTFLYGLPDAPTSIHRPSVRGRQLNLYEVPMSVTKICGRRIGYSGGFYFRFFPAFFIKRAIRQANAQNESAVVYLHPREIDPAENRLELPWKESFIHYYNLAATKEKLEDILRSFKFISIAERLK